ncbi:4'-phosphopantetheinyl transferase family protein [Teredinibacter turnerae]|uniref:4'-phosphopantetheinyl transferase family protein n=1 Tax=Teredinibacter turnerae TaxID=2426 RepID=UPI000382A18A|nr:4'-phosphopantetheinyl transferase superfamily protein [Teredinibacter turnerae]
MLQLHICNAADLTSFSEDSYADFLDQDECARVSRMREPAAVRFLQARFMCKRLLADQLGVSLTQVNFAYTENGKPFLPTAPNLQFSISHCRGAVAVAIASHPIGVDIEDMDRGRKNRAWESPEHFLNAATATAVHSAPSADKAQVFTLLWTLLESQVKLRDSSIVRAARHLRIALERDAQPWRVRTSQDEHGTGVAWLSWSQGGQVVSVAMDSASAETYESAATVEIYRWPERDKMALAMLARG